MPWCAGPVVQGQNTKVNEPRFKGTCICHSIFFMVVSNCDQSDKRQMSLAWNGMETRDERVADVAASLLKDRVDNEEGNGVLRAGLTSWDKRKRRAIAQFCFFVMKSSAERQSEPKQGSMMQRMSCPFTKRENLLVVFTVLNTVVMRSGCGERMNGWRFVLLAGTKRESVRNC